MKYRQISSLFFFPIYFFKQMLWIFILLYKICRKRQKKKKNIFPPTKLSEKKLRVNLEILAFVALKRMGAENIKNHIRATKWASGWMPVRSCKNDHLPLFFCQLVLTNILPSNSTQQHDASSNNSLFKNNPQKNLKGKKACERCEKETKTKSRSSYIYIFVYIYIYLYLYCVPLPLPSPLILY